MQVRALERGYYGDTIRDEGAVFDIASEAHLGSWMEPLEPISAPKAPRKAAAPKVAAPAPEPEAVVDDDV